MFSSESSVENFTHTSLSYLKEKHFDGLDLTWVNGLSSESSDSSELLRNFLKARIIIFSLMTVYVYSIAHI